MGDVERAFGDQVNSIGDIRRYFETGRHGRPMQPNEFIAFWKSLSEEEKQEFMTADLSQG